MRVAKPHFLLFSETRKARNEAGNGAWRIVLEDVAGETTLEVEEREPEVNGDRLDLLAIVRGLEALDQPSRVTLVTNSRYVARGLRYGMPEWRENDWQWERFGQMAPVRNGDLWRRVDRALQYHQVDCRTLGTSWSRGESCEETESPSARRNGRPAPTRVAQHGPAARGSTSWWGRLKATVAGAWRANTAASTTSTPSHAGC